MKHIMSITATKADGVWHIRGYTQPYRDTLKAAGAVWNVKLLTWDWTGEVLPDALQRIVNEPGTGVPAVEAVTTPEGAAKTHSELPGAKVGQSAYAVTPLRRQYLALKAQNPDCLLFFQIGDFYELFDEDAEIGGKVLDLIVGHRLIARNVCVPNVGVPCRWIDTFLPQLTAKGYAVAVAEQVGEMQPGQSLMERKVTRVVRPVSPQGEEGQGQ